MRTDAGGIARSGGDLPGNNGAVDADEARITITDTGNAASAARTRGHWATRRFWAGRANRSGVGGCERRRGGAVRATPLWKARACSIFIDVTAADIG